MCLGVAQCVHHLDPAVQWLERDYEHMYVAVEDEMGWTDGQLNSTILMDRRNKYEWYENQWVNEGEEQGNSTETPQPMFTVKLDSYDDDDVFLSCKWRWNASQGPLLPYEGSNEWGDGGTPAEADEKRSDSYAYYLLNYMKSHEITPSETLVAHVQAWQDERDREDRERKERWLKEAEERRRAQAPEDRIQGMTADYVIMDEAVITQPRGILAALTRVRETLDEIAPVFRAVGGSVPPSRLDPDSHPALLSSGFEIVQEVTDAVQDQSQED